MTTRRLVALSALAALLSIPPSAQDGAPNGEWRTDGGDLGSTRHPALDQINRDNFRTLEVAWRVGTASLLNLVVAIGGGNYPSEFVAFRLP